MMNQGSTMGHVATLWPNKPLHPTLGNGAAAPRVDER
jgi:hypothetical protein